MESLLPSEIARLVYGYLIDEKCESAAEVFLNTSEFLKECNVALQRGRKFNTRVMGLCLIDILNLYTDAVCLLRNFCHKGEPSTEDLTNVIHELQRVLLIDESNAKNSSKTVFLRISIPPKKSGNQEKNEAQDKEMERGASKKEEKKETNSPEDMSIASISPGKSCGPVMDEFDLNMLQTLLDNTTLHERLAENINKAIDSSGEVIDSKQEEKKIVETVLHTTEADPIFDELIHMLAVPRQEDTTTPEDTDKENGDPTEEEKLNHAETTASQEQETALRLDAESNLAIEGILDSNKKIQEDNAAPESQPNTQENHVLEDDDLSLDEHSCSNQQRANRPNRVFRTTKEINENTSKHDEFTLFGKLVAHKLGKFASSPRCVAIAQHAISDILFNLEKEQYTTDRITDTQPNIAVPVNTFGRQFGLNQYYSPNPSSLTSLSAINDNAPNLFQPRTSSFHYSAHNTTANLSQPRANNTHYLQSTKPLSDFNQRKFLGHRFPRPPCIENTQQSLDNHNKESLHQSLTNTNPYLQNARWSFDNNKRELLGQHLTRITPFLQSAKQPINNNERDSFDQHITSNQSLNNSLRESLGQPNISNLSFNNNQRETLGQCNISNLSFSNNQRESHGQPNISNLSFNNNQRESLSQPIISNQPLNNTPIESLGQPFSSSQSFNNNQRESRSQHIINNPSFNNTQGESHGQPNISNLSFNNNQRESLGQPNISNPSFNNKQRESLSQPTISSLPLNNNQRESHGQPNISNPSFTNNQRESLSQPIISNQPLNNTPIESLGQPISSNQSFNNNQRESRSQHITSNQTFNNTQRESPCRHVSNSAPFLQSQR